MGFPQQIAKSGLYESIFNTVTVILAKYNDITFERQRLDSTHFKSNMKKLTRLGVFIRTINEFLKRLKKNHRDLFNQIDPELIERYLSTNSGESAYFGDKKPSENQRTLEQAATDLFSLVNRFAEDPKVLLMSSFKLLKRVLSDQCVVITGETENGQSSVTLKVPKEIPGDSLQNPSDPDATFSGHKGQGTRVQIMETRAESQDSEDNEHTARLITQVAAKPAHVSDARAVIPALEDAISKELAPNTLLADTAYGGDENVQAAAEMGVELVSPSAGQDPESGQVRLAEFQTDENDVVTSCPEGQEPWNVETGKGGGVVAGFDSAVCKNRARCSSCPVGQSGEKAKLSCAPKKTRLSRRLALMNRLMVSKSGTRRVQALREPTATWSESLTSSDYDT